MIAVKSHTEFLKRIDEPRVTFVYYTATWCGPCKVVSPVIERFAESLKRSSFLKVDVDEHDNICEEQGIQSVPTIQVWSGGKMLAQTEGCSKTNVEQLVATHGVPGISLEEDLTV